MADKITQIALVRLHWKTLRPMCAGCQYSQPCVEKKHNNTNNTLSLRFQWPAICDRAEEGKFHNHRMLLLTLHTHERPERVLRRRQWICPEAARCKGEEHKSHNVCNFNGVSYFWENGSVEKSPRKHWKLLCSPDDVEANMRKAYIIYFRINVFIVFSLLMDTIYEKT